MKIHSVHLHPGATKHDVTLAKKHGAPAASMKHLSKNNPWQGAHYIAAPSSHFKQHTLQTKQISPNVTVVHGIKRG